MKINPTFLLSWISPRRHERAFHGIKEDLKRRNAFRYILRWGYQYKSAFVGYLSQSNVFAEFFTIVYHHEKKRAFLWSVQKSEEDTSMNSNFRALASAVWGDTYDDYHVHCGTVETYASYFEQSSMREYMQSRDVKKSLKKTTPPINLPDQTFTRKDALRCLFQLKHGSTELLQQRRFGDLYRLHKHILEDPYKM